MGTRKTWTLEETVASFLADREGFEDSRRGPGHKKELFNANIAKGYAKNTDKVKEDNPKCTCSDSTRDEIVQRHCKAQFECVKFEGIIAYIRAKIPISLSTDNDIVRAPTTFYNGEASVS